VEERNKGSCQKKSNPENKKLGVERGVKRNQQRELNLGDSKDDGGGQVVTKRNSSQMERNHHRQL